MTLWGMGRNFEGEVKSTMVELEVNLHMTNLLENVRSTTFPIEG